MHSDYIRFILDEIRIGIDDFNDNTMSSLKAAYPKSVDITYNGVTLTVPFKEASDGK